MPKVYKPTYNYYNGSTKEVSTFIHVIDVRDEYIYLYSFLYNIRETFNPEQYYLNNAEQFFNQNFDRRRTNNISKPPFCEQSQKTNLLKFSDVVDLGKFELYENDYWPSLNIENCYLVPVSGYRIARNTFGFSDLDPNLNILISGQKVFNSNRALLPDYNYSDHSDTNRIEDFYLLSNLDSTTKTLSNPILSFKTSDIMCINTGFGGETEFPDINILISPFVSKFLSNKVFSPNLTTPNGHTFDYQNRLKLKITGPTTGSVGDSLEYNVTLMNGDFSDTWLNPPDVECYPSCEAGILSHRKVILKNGVGKFKVDTTNLYSGDTFDVKIGWKYITSDSKVSVTLS